MGIIVFPRSPGSQKPPTATRLLLGTPLTDRMIACYLFNELGAALPYNLVTGKAASALSGPKYSESYLQWISNTHVDYLDTGLDFSNVSAGTIVWRVLHTGAVSSGYPTFEWGQNGFATPEFSSQNYIAGTWYCGWTVGADNRATTAATTANYSPNIFATYALTWGPGGTIFYKDGNVVATNATANPAGSVSGTMLIGNSKVGDANGGFEGTRFDYWLAWSRVLQPTELFALESDRYAFLIPQTRVSQLKGFAVAVTAPFPPFQPLDTASLMPVPTQPFLGM